VSFQKEHSSREGCSIASKSFINFKEVVLREVWKNLMFDPKFDGALGIGGIFLDSDILVLLSGDFPMEFSHPFDGWNGTIRGQRTCFSGAFNARRELQWDVHTELRHAWFKFMQEFKEGFISSLFLFMRNFVIDIQEKYLSFSLIKL
jgi:hypothetical protein